MISRTSRVSALFCALAIALPAASCGPDFPEAIFVRQYGPDTPYSTFAGGRLGVLRPSYRVRNLAVAYDILNGRPLSPAEQKAAAAANTNLLQEDSFSLAQNAPAPGFDAWVKARAAFPSPPSTDAPRDRSVPGQSYDSFPNCLDDAFATAARTLADRAAAHGHNSPEVQEWVHGQDQVFSNCGDIPASFANNNYKPAEPPPTSLPAPVGSAPVWLQQDRAYQTAAAHFYAAQYDEALAGFKTVAADHASPWSPVAEYVTARTMIRQATLQRAAVDDAGSSQGSRDAATARELAELRQAQQALHVMRTEPRMAPLRHGIDGLLDYLAIRLDPQQQRLVLTSRLSSAADPTFGQDLIDLTYVTARPLPGLATYQDAPASASPKPALLRADATPSAAMAAWLDAVSTTDRSVAVANWHVLHTNVWLLAALMSAHPGDPANAELIHAEGVPRTDPAWTAITFYRLRLMPQNASTRSALLAVMPALDKNEGPSTVNLFASLDAATAPDLETWLRTAGRVPAADDMEGGEEDLNSGQVTAQEGAPLRPAPQPADQPCGPALFEDKLPLFTPVAAEALNTRMPLSVLATAAESHLLAPNLRFALAQAAWSRAVLLNQPAIAGRMTPILVGCRAAWKPVLSAYDGAATADARHVAGLLALMRFASTEPNVRAGEPREEGFAAYSVLRDNWWDKTVTPALNLSAHNFSAEYENKPGQAREATPADKANSLLLPSPLSFLTAAEKASAQAEVAALEAVPSASDYFAREALAWWHAHPHDPADADLLGEAMRVARNAPRTDNTPANEHALFDALHSAFPASAWAKRYTTWE